MLLIYFFNLQKLVLKVAQYIKISIESEFLKIELCVENSYLCIYKPTHIWGCYHVTTKSTSCEHWWFFLTQNYSIFGRVVNDRIVNKKYNSVHHYFIIIMNTHTINFKSAKVSRYTTNVINTRGSVNIAPWRIVYSEFPIVQ